MSPTKATYKIKEKNLIHPTAAKMPPAGVALSGAHNSREIARLLSALDIPSTWRTKSSSIFRNFQYSLQCLESSWDYSPSDAENFGLKRPCN